jgi:hypothetical protein
VLAARAAIERGDRQGARDLLGGIARGQVPGEHLEPGVADALVATARAEQEERDRLALARYRQAQAAAEQVLRLLRSTPWDRADLGRLRAVLDELDAELRQQDNEQERAERSDGAATSRRRLGCGSLEVKWIPKANGRVNGPYLYFRYWQAGRHRSVYVGKAPSNS